MELDKKLDKLTKAELREMVKRIRYEYGYGWAIEIICDHLEFEKRQAKLNLASQQIEISKQKREEYFELAKKYEGKPMMEIPKRALSKMRKLIEEAQEADRRWGKLMHEIDGE